MVELTPCQLCGANTVEYRERTHWTGMRNIVLAVDIIHHCSGHTPPARVRTVVTGKTKEEAITIWNTRADL